MFLKCKVLNLSGLQTSQFSQNPHQNVSVHQIPWLPQTDDVKAHQISKRESVTLKYKFNINALKVVFKRKTQVENS